MTFVSQNYERSRKILGYFCASMSVISLLSVFTKPSLAGQAFIMALVFAVPVVYLTQYQ
ncbi:hypothetical protein WAF17_12195 [Bernardetia sp. ABR2-2B]|uniref:hypothetical protein n=1 Tax=Bernardetia sp. ABR2-2B TaxID=3127472 RepID=UPI0030D26873